MTRSILLLMAMAVALSAAGCKTAPEGVAPPKPTAVPAPTPAPPAAPVAQRPPAGADFDKIEVTVEIPAQAAPAQAEPGRPAGPHGASGCPMSESGQILGIVIGSPHGIKVSQVLPDGPAAKAGIKVGDSIVGCNGFEVTCPSGLRPMLGSGAKPRTVKLTILRPKAAAAATGPHPAK